MPTLEQEAIILLLQDLNDRKRMGDAMLWKERAHSLLERLGAPFSPYMDTDKAEDKATAHISQEQAKAAWDEMFEDSMKALDGLKPEWAEHDTYTKQLEEICADRRIKCERLQDKVTTLKARLTRQEEELDRLAGLLADAGNEIFDLREKSNKWRERVNYLESECNRIQAYCDDLLAANIRLQNERNQAAVERIEGVA